MQDEEYDAASDAVSTEPLLHTGALPTQRRNAIQFKYTEDAASSMFADNSSTAIAAPSVETDQRSKTYRDLYNLPTDSWEVENCVGMAIERLLKPRWKDIHQLGRSLTIFKVHKQPKVCECFFMPLDEVVKTYTSRFPKCVEWVHLYDPQVEIVFWAELFAPRRGGGRTSLLTDELVGGSGSRFTVVRGDLSGNGGLMADPDKFDEHFSRLLDGREETEERLAEKQAKLEKNRKKKEKAKAKKAEQRAAAEAEEVRAKEEERQSEERQREQARSARMPAPGLAGADFSKMFGAKPKAERPAAAGAGGGAQPDDEPLPLT